MAATCSRHKAWESDIQRCPATVLHEQVSTPFCRQISLEVVRAPGIKSGSRNQQNFPLIIHILQLSCFCDHLMIVYGLALLIANLALRYGFLNQLTARHPSSHGKVNTEKLAQQLEFGLTQNLGFRTPSLYLRSSLHQWVHDKRFRKHSK